MKLLITGGSGLVGSAIQRIIHDYSYDTVFLNSKDCDLSNYEDTLKLFKIEKPEYVIHLAANVGGLFKNINNKVDMFEKNILINYNVIRCSYLVNVKKCISCLSTCIFPDEISYPINENMLHDGPPHNSNYSYAYAKRMLDIHSKVYRQEYNKKFICIIPTNIYGPNDNYNLENAHVIPALIHNCYLAKKNNVPFIIKGTGTPLRQFIYSEDLAILILWILENYNEDDNLILSSCVKDEISISDLSLLIAKIFNYENNCFFDKSYSDGQYKKTVDNLKLLNLIGNFNFTPINIGIEKSIKWFINNYNICRK